MTAFMIISIITFPLLTIVDWNAHNRGKLIANVKIGKIELRDFTISGIQGKALYWHVFAAYIVTLTVCGLVYWSK